MVYATLLKSEAGIGRGYRDVVGMKADLSHVS